MFKPIRTIAGIAAVAAVAGTAAAGTAATSTADAARSCHYWEIPSSFVINQPRNGWTVKTRGKPVDFKWQVSAYPYPRVYTEFGTLKLTRFDTKPSKSKRREDWPKVEFTVALDNGSTGLYTGRIDPDGFIDGTTRDRFNSRAKSDFEVREPLDCA